MRICYVTETYPPEGDVAALGVRRAVHYLRRRGHTVDLIRPLQPADRHANATDSRGTQWLTAGLSIPLCGLRLGLAWPEQIGKRLQFMRTQLVHIATPGPLGWAALQAACSLQLPVTSDYRGDALSYGQFYRLGGLRTLAQRALRGFHNRATLSFVPLRSLAEQLRGDGYARLAVVARGVDTLLFDPARRCPALRTAWGVDPSSTAGGVMLHIGRLARDQPALLALEAYEARRRLQPQTRMVVVGDGPLRAALQARHPSVHFAGEQRGIDLARHCASADLLLLPGATDAHSQPMLEAMAAGLAVIAGDAAAEVLRDGGLVVPGGGQAYIAAVCGIDASEAALQPLRARARAVALAHDWDSVLHTFDQHLASAARMHGLQRVPHALVA